MKRKKQKLGRLNLLLKKSDLIKSGKQSHQSKSKMKMPYEAAYQYIISVFSLTNVSLLVVTLVFSPSPQSKPRSSSPLTPSTLGSNQLSYPTQDLFRVRCVQCMIMSIGKQQSFSIIHADELLISRIFLYSVKSTLAKLLISLA